MNIDYQYLLLSSEIFFYLPENNKFTSSNSSQLDTNYRNKNLSPRKLKIYEFGEALDSHIKFPPAAHENRPKQKVKPINQHRTHKQASKEFPRKSKNKPSDENRFPLRFHFFIAISPKPECKNIVKSRFSGRWRKRNREQNRFKTLMNIFFLLMIVPLFLHNPRKQQKKSNHKEQFSTPS